MARENVYFDLVIEMEETVKQGRRIVSPYIHTTKHSHGWWTFVNIDRNFVKIIFNNGEIIIKFRNIGDMLRFAEKLYETIIDMVNNMINHILDYSDLTPFMKREFIER